MQTGDILTLKEVAVYLNVHPSTIYRFIKRHQMVGFKIGGRDWRFQRKDIEAWVEAQTAKQRAEWDNSIETDAHTPRHPSDRPNGPDGADRPSPQASSVPGTPQRTLS